MYRENYINSLRTELVKMVSNNLSPAALHYGYSDVPLETNIKWRPLVLVIGNYSSGKSTLINEFLGADIQATGQAPTDDSFTVITYDDSMSAATDVQIVEERDGKFLLNDPEYPFETMRKHGQRFAAHFRLKKVNAPFLETIAIIETASPSGIAGTIIRKSSVIWPKSPIWFWLSSTPIKPEPCANLISVFGKHCQAEPLKTV
jgi:EH domain-containing protein 1